MDDAESKGLIAFESLVESKPNERPSNRQGMTTQDECAALQGVLMLVIDCTCL